MSNSIESKAGDFAIENSTVANAVSRHLCLHQYDVIFNLQEQVNAVHTPFCTTPLT